MENNRILKKKHAALMDPQVNAATLTVNALLSPFWKFRFRCRNPRTIRLLALIGALGLTSGCIPIPHTTERSCEISGIVVDADTHLAIPDAKVQLLESPHHTTYTDHTGQFHLPATRNFHWLYVPPEGDWPERKDNSIEVSCPHYTSYDLLPNTMGTMDVGYIYLKPGHLSK